jgi:serine/threonine protein kinase
VADFGIASAAGMDSLTATGTILGTAAYLSPEQASGQRATAASDLYGLGVVAFELLTGERPYQADSSTAEAAAHIHAPIPSALERNPDLPSRVDSVFRRVLAKRPDERYGSCAEFVDALRGALRRPRTATTEPIPVAPAVPAPARRRGVPVWPIVLALALAAGAIGAIVAGVVASGGDSPQAREVTRTVRQRGTTRTITTTVQATSSSRSSSTTTAAAPPTPPPPPPSPPSGTSGASLNNAGFARMQAGDYQGALPLLEQAVAKLSGTSSLDEAYADYNLAFTRLQLGSCDGVTDLLDRSESVQGHRKEIDRARKQAEKQCS